MSLFDIIMEQRVSLLLPIMIVVIFTMIYYISRKKLNRVGPTLKQSVITVWISLLSFFITYVMIGYAVFHEEIYVAQIPILQLTIVVTFLLSIILPFLLFCIMMIGLRKRTEPSIESSLISEKSAEYDEG